MCHYLYTVEPHLSGYNPHSSTESASLIWKFSYPDIQSGNGGVRISEARLYIYTLFVYLNVLCLNFVLHICLLQVDDRYDKDKLRDRSDRDPRERDPRDDRDVRGDIRGERDSRGDPRQQREVRSDRDTRVDRGDPRSDPRDKERYILTFNLLIKKSMHSPLIC